MRIRNRNRQEWKDEDYHVQQQIPESTMKSSNIIDLTIKSLDKNKKERGQEGSFQEELLGKRQQQEEDNDEFELNIITSNDNVPNNKDNNIDSGSNLPIRDEKDQNYYRLKQGIPRSTKFRSIINIYKFTNRLSSPEDEYNWRCPSTLENKKAEVYNKGKTGKDQEGSLKKTLPNKGKQKVIHGEFESLGENCLTDNSNHDSKIDNRKINSSRSTKNRGQFDFVQGLRSRKKHNYNIINKRISNNTLINFINDLCEVIENERLEEHDESKTRKEDSFEEEIPNHQQEQKDINGESELNRITGEDSFPDRNNDRINYGSKLWARDEKDKNYHITQGIPRSIKFRSISNLYKCTNRFSAVEDEYNWNLQIEEDPNMYLSTKEDSSNKKNVGCKRKLRENQEDKRENDATSSSTSKIAF